MRHDVMEYRVADIEEKDATIARLREENDVLREQNLMMNKSGVEKSARIKELEGALEKIIKIGEGK